MNRISFVGDLMFKEQAVPVYLNRDNVYDFSCIFKHIKPELEKSQYVAGNLETTINDIGDSKYSEGVNFNAPVEFLRDLKAAGFSYLSTGNNHCLNRKIEGLKRTIENLERFGFDHGGTNYDNFGNKKYSVINIGECKIALLSYTYGTNTLINKYFLSKNDVGYVNLFQEQQYQNKRALWFASNPFFGFRWLYRLYAAIRGEAHLGEQSEHVENNSRCRKEILEQIDTIKNEEDPDYIIMMMHAGGRYHVKPSPWEVELAGFLMNNGIDIIIGNHEHRVQRMEISHNKCLKMCAFDLGNFCSTTGVINKPYHKLSEYSLILNLYIDGSVIKKGSVIPCKSVLENNKVVIFPVYDLLKVLKRNNERKKTVNETEKVLSIFFGRKISFTKREFFFHV